ncbi:methyltransferase domain-containing protein [Candidatus Woesearchaeota archaeon]|nr:methyltransferase domain-containing protein [Candidatus Woesearchaeota archaeon]
MAYLFLLSKENLPLAADEATRLLQLKRARLVQNALMADGKIDEALVKRLAYTRKALRVLFSCEQRRLLERIGNADLQPHYQDSFSVRSELVEGTQHVPLTAIADAIYARLERPTVRLRDAQTRFVVVFIGKAAHCCLELWSNAERFRDRAAHKRPGMHPSSMDPRLARAMVNLSGATREVCDPFCGAGSILIEAGLMGLACVGFDISPKMIALANANMDHYRISMCTLSVGDATRLRGWYEAVVTDVPYARATTTTHSDLAELYSLALGRAKGSAGSVVVCLPDSVDHRKVVRAAGLRIASDHAVYVHRSLTKHVLVLTA